MQLIWNCLLSIAFLLEVIGYNQIVMAQDCEILTNGVKPTLDSEVFQQSSNQFTFNKGVSMWKCVTVQNLNFSEMTVEMAPALANTDYSTQSVLENNSIALFVTSTKMDPYNIDLLQFLYDRDQYSEIICFSYDGLLTRQLFPKLLCKQNLLQNFESLHIYFLYKYNLSKFNLVFDKGFSKKSQFSEVDKTKIQMKFVINFSQKSLNKCQVNMELYNSDCTCKNSAMITQYCNVEATNLKEIPENHVVSPNKDGIIYLYIFSDRLQSRLDLDIKSQVLDQEFISYFTINSSQNQNNYLPIHKFFLGQQRYLKSIEQKQINLDNVRTYAIISKNPIIINVKKEQKNPIIINVQKEQKNPIIINVQKEQSNDQKKDSPMIWIILIAVVVFIAILVIAFLIKKYQFCQKKPPESPKKPIELEEKSVSFVIE